ncbi:SDR family oxidoreductase [Aggregatimonas sangjinii]|uniref:SDR family oxidoreductase n=1 Tax=Aggregatimonas sangjinii TaxID=2583587 RepID=A0A5B7SQY8_9FLAO|nr:SDR family oxidoreductase [Aggregatimonas sangjinii]QCW99422.1 SDR family oxidoreductase [Aggregatimonas sangjinii]
MKNHKIALVTGANRGIGFAVAKELLKKDVTVIVTSRSEDDGIEAVKKLSEYGKVIYHQLDVTDKASINSCYAFAKAEFGKLDILINNAGINYDTHQNIENANLDEVLATFKTNAIAPLQMTQTFLPLLRNSDRASIVNVSSGSGALASQDGSTPGYSLSKLGLNGITLALANQLKNDGILVNSVCPGWVRTDMGGGNADRSPEKGAETIVWTALLKDGIMTGKFFRDKQVLEW